jgi:hypothetical protein
MIPASQISKLGTKRSKKDKIPIIGFIAEI